MKPFLKSLDFAIQGIVYVLRTQRNARIHTIIALLAIAAGVYFRITAVEWAIVLLTIGFVFSAEMINSVAELAVDLLTQQFHPLAKIAKDVGAGAVLIAALAAVAVGASLFGPRLWPILFGR